MHERYLQHALLCVRRGMGMGVYRERAREAAIVVLSKTWRVDVNAWTHCVGLEEARRGVPHGEEPLRQGQKVLLLKNEENKENEK